MHAESNPEVQMSVAFGVATITLPRPVAGDPFLIYRASTIDGFKISPPIVVSPGI